MVRRFSPTSRGTTYWFQFLLSNALGFPLRMCKLARTEMLTIIKKKKVNKGETAETVSSIPGSSRISR